MKPAHWLEIAVIKDADNFKEGGNTKFSLQSLELWYYVEEFDFLLLI